MIVSGEAASALWLRSVLPAKACLTVREAAKTAHQPSWAAGSIWRNHHLALNAALAARQYVDEAKFRLRELPEPA